MMAVARMMRYTGGSLFGRGPDVTGVGTTGVSLFRSSAIFLVVCWPSDWFAVTLTVKIPALE